MLSLTDIWGTKHYVHAVDIVSMSGNHEYTDVTTTASKSIIVRQPLEQLYDVWQEQL